MPGIKKETAVAVPLDNQIIAHEEHEVNEKLDIDLWIKQRQEFKTKVGSIMVEKADYHIIQNRKSLAKGGAEKIASIWGWAAEFEKDSETLEMIGDIKGTLCYVCNLKDKHGRIVGQGRGAANLAKNAGDVNKAIKMAQKSAFIDAVLRASGLSDIYTQDLEDMELPKRQTATTNRTWKPAKKSELVDEMYSVISKAINLDQLEDIARQITTLSKEFSTTDLNGLRRAYKAKQDELSLPVINQNEDELNQIAEKIPFE